MCQSRSCFSCPCPALPLPMVLWSRCCCGGAWPWNTDRSCSLTLCQLGCLEKPISFLHPLRPGRIGSFLGLDVPPAEFCPGWFSLAVMCFLWLHLRAWERWQKSSLYCVWREIVYHRMAYVEILTCFNFFPTKLLSKLVNYMNKFLFVLRQNQI